MLQMLWTCSGLHPIFIYICIKVQMFLTLYKPYVMFLSNLLLLFFNHFSCGDVIFGIFFLYSFRYVSCGVFIFGIFAICLTIYIPLLTHSQLFEGLESESKQKTAEGGGVGACSLAQNTLRGRGACWSSGMGLGRVDKLHSLTRACTQPTQSGQCIVGTPLVLGRATGNMDTQDSPWPRLGGSHHLPPYRILCTSPRGLHPNGFSLLGLLSGNPEIVPAKNLATLEPHNFVSRPWIEVRSKQSCGSRRELSNGMSHVVCN